MMEVLAEMLGLIAALLISLIIFLILGGAFCVLSTWLGCSTMKGIEKSIDKCRKKKEE